MSKYGEIKDWLWLIGLALLTGYGVFLFGLFVLFAISRPINFVLDLEFIKFFLFGGGFFSVAMFLFWVGEATKDC